MSAVRRFLTILPALALAGVARAQEPPDPRKELDPFARALDGAVRKVSRANVVLGAGDTCRAYRIEGVGAMFVVAPRALPMPARRVVRLVRGTPDVLEQQGKELQAQLAAAPNPAIRARIEQRLKAVRATLEWWRERQRFTKEAKAAHDREMQVARDARARAAADARKAPAAPPDSAEARASEIEADMWAPFGPPNEAERNAVRALLADTERFREEAERAFEQMQIEWKLRLESPNGDMVLDPGFPPGFDGLADPSWSVWFSTDESDDRSAENVVADVRGAVVSVLEARGAALRTVRPEELVMVAVDFQPTGLLVARRAPERTLMVRVKKKDLDDLQAGRLTAEAFRQKVEAVEY